MRVLAYLLVVFLVAVLLLLSLPFSNTGTRWIVRGADALSFITLDYREGNLLGDLRLNQLRVEVEGVVVTLDDVSLHLERACLLRSAFCLRYLHAENLLVEVAESALEDTPDDDEDFLLEMPYPVSSDDVRIGQARVTWPGGAWEQGELKGAARFAGSLLQVPVAELQSGRLWIESGDDEGYSGFEPERIFLPLEIEAGRVQLAAGVLDLAGWVAELKGVEMSGAWRGTRLAVEQLAVAQFDTGSMMLESIEGPGALDFSVNWPLQWSVAARTAGEAWPDTLRQRGLNLKVDGDFSSLSLALESASDPALAAEGSLNILSPGLPFTAQGAAQWPEGSTLAVVSAEVPEQLAELVLTTPIAFSATGNLDAQSLQLTAAVSGLGYEALELRGQASVEEGSRLLIETLSLTDAASETALAFIGHATLQPSWSVQGELQSPGFQLPENLLPGAGRILGSASVEARGEGDSWELVFPAIDLSGRVKGLPATVQGFAGIASSMQLLPADLNAELNGAQLRLTLDGKGGATDEFRMTVDDLGRWVEDGRGSVNVWARGTLLQGDVQLGGNAEGVQLDSLRLPTATLAGQWRRQAGQIALELNAPTLEYSERELQNLVLALQGREAEHHIGFSVDGELSTSVSINGGFTAQGWRGQLAPLELHTPSGPWLLDQSVDLEWQTTPYALAVAPHCWNHPEFELCAQRANVGLAGDIDLSLTGDISAFNGLLPPDLRMQGELDTHWVASWNAQRSLKLAAEGKATDIEITRLFGLGETASLAWDIAEVHIRRGEDRLTLLDGTIERGGRRVVAVSATLPAQRDGELRGEVQLNALQLTAFAPWASLFSDLGGAVSGDLILGGQLRSPTVDGQLALSGGHALVEGNPTAVTELNLELALAGWGGKVRGNGLLGGGPVRLNGDFSWLPEAQFDLSIEGDNQRILLPPTSEAVITEKLQLAYIENTLDISGEIRVTDGVLRHEELPEGSVALSSDVVEVDTAGDVIHESQPFQIRTDLWLYINEKFEVRGNNFQAVLGGRLHLEQEPTRPPQLFGALNIGGGELNAYRQRLEIRRGTVDFSGPLQTPGLDVTAERRIRADNVTVGAHLFGTLESPQLEIYSDPPMSQGEAMSYLIRGRGLDAGAGADGTALALSVGADVVNQSGIVKGLNRLPLINNVAFGSSGDEDETAATVGGYLGDRIYMSYGIGLYEPINEFTARLYLQSRLWLEVVSRLENSVDLYYSFDIN